jgi:hypothetical protein
MPTNERGSTAFVVEATFALPDDALWTGRTPAPPLPTPNATARLTHTAPVDLWERLDPAVVDLLAGNLIR